MCSDWECRISGYSDADFTAWVKGDWSGDVGAGGRFDFLWQSCGDAGYGISWRPSWFCAARNLGLGSAQKPNDRLYIAWIMLVGAVIANSGTPERFCHNFGWGGNAGCVVCHRRVAGV